MSEHTNYPESGKRRNFGLGNLVPRLGYRITSMLAAVFIAITGIVAINPLVDNQASAYTPITADQADQAPDSNSPHVKASMSYDNVTYMKNGVAVKRDSKETPHRGDSLDYHARFKFTGMEDPFKDRDVKITISPSQTAPFVDGQGQPSDPSASDFSGLPAGATIERCGDKKGFTFCVKGLDQNATIKFDKKAKVKQGSDKQAYSVASVSATVDNTPKIKLEQPKQVDGQTNPNFVGDSDVPTIEFNGKQYACEGTMQFVWDVKGSGGWLVDLKFGDAAGNGEVVPDDIDRLDNGADNPDSKNSLKIIPSSNSTTASQATARVLNQGKWAKSDKTKPIYGADDKVVEDNKENTKWLGAENWKYNPASFSGKTWVNHGDRVVVKRHVRFKNCVAPGASTNFDPNRRLIANLQTGRATEHATDGASSIFVIPGKVDNVNVCGGNVFASEYYNFQEPHDHIDIGYVNDPGQKVTDYDTNPISTNPEPKYTRVITDAQETPKSSSEKNWNANLVASGYKETIDGKEIDLSKDLFSIYEDPSKGSGGSLVVKQYHANGAVFDDGQVSKTIPSTLPGRPGLFGSSKNPLSGSTTGGALIGPDGRMWIVLNKKGSKDDAYLYSFDLAKALRYPDRTYTWIQQGKLKLPNDTGLLGYNFESGFDAASFGSPKVAWMVHLKAFNDSVTAIMTFDLPDVRRQSGPNESTTTSDQEVEVTQAALPLKHDKRGSDKLHLFYKGEPFNGVAFDSKGHLVLGGARSFEGDRKGSLWVSEKTWANTPELNEDIYAQNGSTQGGDYKGKGYKALVMNELEVDNNITHLGYADLASCSAADQSSPDNTPSFEIKKYPVDPKSGNVDDADSATDNKVQVDAEGNFEVSYYIVVSNLGSKAGAPGTVEDAIQLPRGIKLQDGDDAITVSSGSKTLATSRNTKFQLPTISSLKPAGKQGSSKQFKVTVKLKADLQDPSAVDWEDAGKCELGKNRRDDTGIYNSVNLLNKKGESTSSSYACVPVDQPPTATITLKKQIVKQDGSVVTANANDPRVQAFTLAAGPAPKEGNNSNIGSTSVVGKSGEPGVTQRVVRLPYPDADGDSSLGFVLSESLTNDKYAGYRQYGDWSCVGGNFDQDSDSITLHKDDDVTCTISNTNPKVWVAKFPFAGPNKEHANNEHYGENAKVDGNGNVDLKYVIYTNTDSTVPVNSGSVFDTFNVPEGLAWRDNCGDDKSSACMATVEAAENADQTGATWVLPDGQEASDDTVLQLAQQQLEGSATIAHNIKGVRKVSDNQDGKKGFGLVVTIPLKVDDQWFETHKKKAESRVEQLGKCESNQGDNNVTGNEKFGAVNHTSIADEEQSGTGNSSSDNKACIPVPVNPKFTVNKSAMLSADPNHPNDPSKATYSKPGENGNGVKLQKSKTDSSGTITLNYRVRVTNTGKVPGFHPDITDTTHLHGGFTIKHISIVGKAAGSDQTTPIENATCNNKDRPCPLTSQVTDGGFEKVVITIPGGPKDQAVPAKKPGQSGNEANNYYDYFITVTGYIDDVEKINWKVTTECTSVKGACSHGEWNNVQMDGDDDEPDNDVCIPVIPELSILVRKLDAAGNALSGADFDLRSSNKTQNGNKEVFQIGDVIDNGIKKNTAADTAPGAENGFSTKPLKVGGVYWLDETKAPTGAELLPEPMAFTITDEGKLVSLKVRHGDDGFYVNSTDDVLTDDSTYQVENRDKSLSCEADGVPIGDPKDSRPIITVKDPEAMHLPKTGGFGVTPFAAGGVLLLMFAAWASLRGSATAKRRRG